jgi:hypothetical protein
MSDYRYATVIDYWFDKEFNSYYSVIETVEMEIRLIITPVSKEFK